MGKLGPFQPGATSLPFFPSSLIAEALIGKEYDGSSLYKGLLACVDQLNPKEPRVY